LVYNDTINNPNILNTFYPVASNLIVTSGATSIELLGVPQQDQFGNSYGNTPIYPGDVILIIQMQGATFNSTNSNLYGGNSASIGPDNLGGTGALNTNNVGIYEFVIAQNTVPLTGGTLQINGTCSNGGVLHNYMSSQATTTTGQARFQVVRVPRFLNLTLQQNMSTTAWNGTVGGILAFFVQENLNLNGYSILADGKGFRGGYQNVRPSGSNVTAIATTDIMLSSGKGEGICGTPRFLWNGQNQVDNGSSWLGYPGGNYGRGAPGNAGGGGNTHNAGGGGGGGFGSGGVAGNGIVASGAASWPNGGRPGLGLNLTYQSIVFGGGGGGGDANNAQTGVKGGAGGGIIFIKAGQISGSGTINVSGTNGQVGVFGAAPDGAGGGGGGGTIVVFSDATNNSATLNLIAKGGNGGNTLNDSNDPHGPGGGGGGGKIYYNITGANISNQVSYGNSGLTNDGNSGSHGAANGHPGFAETITPVVFYQTLPPAINPKPTANFEVTDICQGENYTFLNTSTISNSGGNSIASYNWNLGNGTSSIEENPQHIYTSAGSYSVTLIIVSNFGCTDTIVQTVNVFAPFSFLETVTACDEFDWPTNNFTYTQSGLYTQNYNSIHGCDSTYQLSLLIHPSYLTSIQDTICSDETITIGTNSFNSSGNYIVILESLQGCDSTIQLDLIVNPMPPMPNLTVNYVKCPNEPLFLNADSIPNASIQWYGPNNFSSQSFLNDFIITNTLTGVYSATLNQLNCISAPSFIDVAISSDESYSNWEIPNVITPNNDDINDEWFLPELAQSCEDFQLLILNRWGNTIIQIDQDNPIFRGEDSVGNELIEGIYFYRLLYNNENKYGFFHLVK
jgi:gliding motility-associated-like protein